MAKIHAVIQTRDHRGGGTKDSPHRNVLRVWSLAGKCIAEADPSLELFIDELQKSLQAMRDRIDSALQLREVAAGANQEEVRTTHLRYAEESMNTALCWFDSIRKSIIEER